MCLENGLEEKVTRSLHYCKFEHEAQCFVDSLHIVCIVMSLPERSITMNACLHMCSSPALLLRTGVHYYLRNQSLPSSSLFPHVISTIIHYHPPRSTTISFSAHFASYIYIIPEPRPIRDRPLTQVPPLCSPVNARFVDMLSFCSPMLPRCSPLLPHCSLMLPLCSTVFPLSHFLLFSW